MHQWTSKPDKPPPSWVLWLVVFSIIALILAAVSCSGASLLSVPEHSTNHPPIDFTAGGLPAYYYTNTYCHSYTMTIFGDSGDYQVEWSTNLSRWHPLWPVYTKHHQPLTIVVPSPTNYPTAFFRLKQIP